MNIRRSAFTLTEALKPFPWFRFVGVGVQNGKPVLLAYVSKHPNRLRGFNLTSWDGIPIVIRRMASPHPVGHH